MEITRMGTIDEKGFTEHFRDGEDDSWYQISEAFDLNWNPNLMDRLSEFAKEGQVEDFFYLRGDSLDDYLVFLLRQSPTTAMVGLTHDAESVQVVWITLTPNEAEHIFRLI